MPHFYKLKGHHAREPEREQRHERLNRHNQLSPVRPVSEHASERSDDKTRQRIHAPNSHDEQSGAWGSGGQVLHQPAEREKLEPVRGVGEEVADPEKPVVTMGNPCVESLWTGKGDSSKCH